MKPNSVKAIGTGVFETLPCQLLIKSIGYKSAPLEGLSFNYKTNTFPNIQGRIVGAHVSNDAKNNASVTTNKFDNNFILPNVYVVGWAKRGPTGIIGSNIPDAQETAACVLEDLSKRNDRHFIGISRTFVYWH